MKITIPETVLRNGEFINIKKEKDVKPKPGDFEDNNVKNALSEYEKI